MTKRLAVLALTLATLLYALPAFAHKPSDSYVTLAVSGANVEVRWDIALRDLANILPLDRDEDGAVTWGELKAHEKEIFALAADHLELRADDSLCAPASRDMRVVSHSDGAYAVLRFDATCPAEPRVLGVAYELFFDVDPQHHGIVRIDDAAGTRTAIFTATERRQSFELASVNRSRQLTSAIRLGIGHIFSGIDHLLFLVALLLPAVLVRRDSDGVWLPAPTMRAAVLDVLRIVTAFTIAHSITLSLSALEVLRLPSRLTEAGIAASVVIAAANNIYPVLEKDRWSAAFALGLLHGFGFSATLMDLGLPRQNLVLTLFGFNVGVEIGQLCVVAVFLPLAYLARGTRAYRRVGLVGGSAVIMAVASVWFVERAFAVKLF